MEAPQYKIPTYPIVTFLVAHGAIPALAISALPAGLAIYLVSLGWPGSVLAIGVGVTVVLAVLLLSYIEVLRIIADTLMPK